MSISGVDQELLEGDADFFSSSNTAFTVPPNLARSGTTAQKTSKACKDSPDEEFYVDGKAGDRKCAWLSQNLEHFDYLCEFVSVASVCPHTCAACSLFT